MLLRMRHCLIWAWSPHCFGMRTSLTISQYQRHGEVNHFIYLRWRRCFIDQARDDTSGCREGDSEHKKYVGVSRKEFERDERFGEWGICSGDIGRKCILISGAYSEYSSLLHPIRFGQFWKWWDLILPEYEPKNNKSQCGPPRAPHQAYPRNLHHWLNNRIYTSESNWQTVLGKSCNLAEFLCSNIHLKRIGQSVCWDVLCLPSS